jgi:cellulose synthase (UDP-forming)
MATELDMVVGEATADAMASERERNHQMYSPVMQLVTFIATAGILAYAVFLLNPRNRGDILPYAIVIIAEAVLIFHALMAMWIIISGMRGSRAYSYYVARQEMFVPEIIEISCDVPEDSTQWPIQFGGRTVAVDILITVYGEPVQVIERTVRAALAVRGRHATYILDDGDSDEVRALATRVGCHYIRRLTHNGAKAGNINNALTVAKGEFFVILDADFVPRPNLIAEILPHMADERVAFVQTPQVYGNMHNILSRGAGYMQTVFYKYIQTGRNRFNAAFCVGTNVMFRRSAVLEIGGMYTGSKSEDVWTSLMLHENGWRSVYTPITVAVGDTPETIEDYSKQQLRWATGGFEILFTHNPLSPRRRLAAGQRLMYFVTASFYLVGITPGLLMTVPLLEIFFDLHPMNLTVSWWQWLLYYSGFYVMQIILASVVLGSFRWEVLVLSVCSFPIYAKALVNVLLGVDQAWSVTGAARKRASAFNFMIPQVLILAVVILALGTSIWRDARLGFLNIATVWLAVNFISLMIFVWIGIQEGIDARRSVAGAQPEIETAASSGRRMALVPVVDRHRIEGARRDISTVADTGEPDAIEWPDDDPMVAQPLPRRSHDPSSVEPPRRVRS